MARIVLDTSVLIGGAPALGVDDLVSVSSVTYAELEVGARFAHAGEERARRVRRLALARETYGPGLPFDDRVATSFGMLADLVRGSGRLFRSRTADLMIAATAHAHDATLLTRNAGDFRGLDRAVTVVDPGLGGPQPAP